MVPIILPELTKEELAKVAADWECAEDLILYMHAYAEDAVLLDRKRATKCE